jgi:hypothetical protein
MASRISRARKLVFNFLHALALRQHQESALAQVGGKCRTGIVFVMQAALRDCWVTGCENFPTTPMDQRSGQGSCVRSGAVVRRAEELPPASSIGRDEYRRYGNSAVRARMDGAGGACVN